MPAKKPTEIRADDKPSAPEEADKQPLLEPTEQELQERVAALETLLQEQSKLLREVAESKLDEAARSGALDVAEIVRISKAVGESAEPTYAPLTGEERHHLDAIDPLAWVDEQTEVVFFVGRVSSIGIRKAGIHHGTGINIPKMHLRKTGTIPWISCPYVFDSPDPVETIGNRLMNRDWHRFALTRQTAMQMWVGTQPFPVETVVVPEEFDGLIHGQLQGRKRLGSGIVMREAVRYILQTNPEMIWLDTDRYCPGINGALGPNHEFIPHDHINALEPNPYAKGCPGARGNVQEFYDNNPWGPSPATLNRGRSAEVGGGARIQPEDYTPTLARN